jgi:hypothetical protein
MLTGGRPSLSYGLGLLNVLTFLWLFGLVIYVADLLHLFGYWIALPDYLDMMLLFQVVEWGWHSLACDNSLA